MIKSNLFQMIKQNPFSVYDFLGYFIPGFITIIIFQNIDYFTNYDSFKEILKSFYGQDYKIESITILIIISYIIGHVISFISSITIERYAIWRYNFPSKYLLEFKHNGYWKSSKNWTDSGWRFVLVFMLFPVVFFDFILGKLLRFSKFYQQSLDKPLQDLIVFKANKLLKKLGFSEIEGYKKDGSLNYSDFHRILAHYAYEYSQNHQSKLTNYVALYGFLRTLCLIFNSVTMFCVFKILIEENTFQCFKENISFILLLSFISYVFFMAFMKFYRRYSLECMMVVTILELEKDN